MEREMVRFFLRARISAQIMAFGVRERWHAAERDMIAVAHQLGRFLERHHLLAQPHDLGRASPRADCR